MSEEREFRHVLGGSTVSLKLLSLRAGNSAAQSGQEQGQSEAAQL